MSKHDPPSQTTTYLKRPCSDCPFRPRTFTPLTSDDAAAMLDAVTFGSFFMYCHKDITRRMTECAGSVLFKAGDSSGAVFKSDTALLRAHTETRREPEYVWDHDNILE